MNLTSFLLLFLDVGVSVLFNIHSIVIHFIWFSSFLQFLEALGWSDFYRLFDCSLRRLLYICNRGKFNLLVSSKSFIDFNFHQSSKELFFVFLLVLVSNLKQFYSKLIWFIIRISLNHLLWRNRHFVRIRWLDLRRRLLRLNNKRLLPYNLRRLWLCFWRWQYVLIINSVRSHRIRLILREVVFGIIRRFWWSKFRCTDKIWFFLFIVDCFVQSRLFCKYHVLFQLSVHNFGLYLWLDVWFLSSDRSLISIVWWNSIDILKCFVLSWWL